MNDFEALRYSKERSSRRRNGQRIKFNNARQTKVVDLRENLSLSILEEELKEECSLAQ